MILIPLVTRQRQTHPARDPRARTPSTPQRGFVVKRVLELFEVEVFPSDGIGMKRDGRLGGADVRGPGPADDKPAEGEDGG